MHRVPKIADIPRNAVSNFIHWRKCVSICNVRDNTSIITYFRFKNSATRKKNRKTFPCNTLMTDENKLADKMF